VHRFIWLGLLIGMTSCSALKEAVNGEDETTEDPTDGTADEGSADEGEVVNTDHYMEIRSKVMVELYTTNDDGQREFLSWDEAVGPVGEFPFGSIFVAAYKPEDEGRQHYFDEHTVTRPRVTGDTYRLQVDPEATGVINIYATLDVRSDGIVGSAEPLGIHPDPIEVEAYGEMTDADLVILVDWDRWGPGGWGWQDVGGYVPPVDSDGDGIIDDTPECQLIAIAGNVTLNGAYSGGNGMVMLLDNAGGGPYQQDEFTPIPTGSGATAEYNMGVCANAGPMQIIGAYDSNGNGLVDPADLWGAYVTSPGENGNPLMIEDVRLDEINVDIPIGGGGPAVSVVPFVHLSGIAFPESQPHFSSFETVEGAGVDLYVVALQYPLSFDMDVESFEEDGYAVKVWESSALGSAESVEWDLTVPANTVVYLYAFVDTDLDGIVNEELEPRAFSGSGEVAALSTGEDGLSGIVLRVALVPRTDK
jgi:hypothetical protein|tara:strand:- start:13 stop:1437 length:1425 start_codon:yes stop_codon:yes gene_type:complete